MNKILVRIVQVIKNNDSDLANEIARIINQRKFKFSELSKKAQKAAAQDYADEYNDSKSWDEFDEGDRLTLRDGYIGSKDCEDDLFYDINGKVLDE